MNTQDSPQYPKAQGKVDIYPEIHEGRTISIVIMGDPEGLTYLAKVLRCLADYNQEDSRAPAGSQEHVHLHAAGQLGNHSCEVEICRADTKGGGELPGGN